MKRSIRYRLDFVVTIDDRGEGIPHVSPGEVIAGAARVIAGDRTVTLEAGGKLSASMTRDSVARMRAGWKDKKR